MLIVRPFLSKFYKNHKFPPKAYRNTADSKYYYSLIIDWFRRFNYFLIAIFLISVT
ncbi:hypothetical protein SULYE_1542 [Sulfurihydrogenibium yellowstonense SS-5]|uniref:Uncharacterized protein n=1 Tax=Sulfurihydrogenibium yellowstonense SS-5 TaxID=432331 RepID=C4FLT8_9AQUI|nr:hypothetical protein SULYE_1542 [Sulfurihydrogenibium yellowstonense SS-5]